MELTPLDRPGLRARLTEAARRRLALVTGPAGIGKSTLLAQWIGAPRPPGSPEVVHVPMAPGHREPQAFLAALASALGSATGPDATGQGMTVVRNRLASRSGGVVVVLDDYHVARSEELDGTLGRLLELLPQNAHLVVGTRVAPKLPMARLRSQGELGEIRESELRFGLDESMSLLEQCRVPVPAIVAHQLVVRAEGWPVALQLAAGIAHERGDASGLSTFSGRHRAVSAYFEEEVLSRVPAQMREFLLTTSILERSTGDLCDRLRPPGSPPSQAMLERLEDEGLFLVPLDEERRWWRLHGLFREFLQSSLERADRTELVRLHREAAAWFEAHELTREASLHAFAAGDFAAMGRTLEHQSWRAGLGRTGPLLDALRALPPGLAERHPALRLTEAWALLGTGELEALELLLSEGGGTSPPPGPLATLAALHASLRGDLEVAAERARAALEQLSPPEKELRGLAQLCLGQVQEAKGVVAAARSAYRKALALSQGREPALGVIARTQLGDVEYWQGSLREGVGHYEEAVRLGLESGEATAMAGLANARLAAIAYEWNDLRSADRHCSRALELSRGWDAVDLLATATIQLAHVRQAEGDSRTALRLAERLPGLLQGRVVSPATSGVVVALRVRLALRQGDLSLVEQWLPESASPAGSAEERHARLGTRARALLALGRADEADRELAKALAEGSRPAATLELQMLQALALASRGEVIRAERSIEEVLAWAVPGGWTRLFVDEGEPMRRLLTRAARRHTPLAAYARGLLAAASAGGEANSGAPPPKAGGVPVERLSPRELEVLSFVADGLANPDIARRLFISLATVKTHLNNIYGKLGARSRIEAVTRARRSGLL